LAKSRLNPSPNSRATLIELQGKNVLTREVVGLRHLIRASTNTVEYVGFDLPDLYGFHYNCDLPNFHPSVPRVQGRVTYNESRAEIIATTGRAGYQGDRLDVSAYFPINQIATDLLLQPCTKNACFSRSVPMYGDAILVTDKRMHWVLRPWQVKASDEEIELFDLMLKTPRDLIREQSGGVWIFFHEEPSQHDLVALKMRWIR